MVVNIKKWIDIKEYKYVYTKLVHAMLGKLTICIDNAGPLWGHCIVAVFGCHIDLAK